MASPLTGSNELLYVQTEKLSVSIKGRTDRIDLLRRNNLSTLAELKVFSSESCQVEVYPDQVESVEARRSQKGVLFLTSRPLFFEQEDYDLVVEHDGQHRVEFWHENYRIRNAITPTGRKSSMLSGILKFRNDIGLTDLVIRLDGQDYLRVVLEIFPSKLDYREDYQALVQDIADELYGLVFDLLRVTYQNYGQSDRQQNSLIEFFAIIKRVYFDFTRALDVILARPHHQLQIVQEILPSHKIKHINKKTLRWLEKHPDQLKKGERGYSAAQSLAVKKQISYNTRENRLVKVMLSTLLRKLTTFKRLYSKVQRDVDPEVLAQIDGMVSGIDRRLNQSFLKSVESNETIYSLSLVFSMAPGYRDLYKYYLMLTRGLSITGDIFSISTKDLAVLYEYWCFIKMSSILRKQYHLVSQDILKMKRTGLSITLTKGSRSLVRFRHPITGDLIELYYNPMKTQLPTVAQQPDNVLRLSKTGAERSFEYIFDAKYRINPALQDTEQTYIGDTPGPREDDINTMHRYRDAIVYGKGYGPYEHSTVGAYVLFPYKDEEEYRFHHFYKSIEKVNIGGLPFLPSATSLVEEILEDLVADSPESAFNRLVLPEGLEDKLAKLDWQRRDVLVVSTRDHDHIKDILKNSEYRGAFSGIKENFGTLRYLALYQSKREFGSDSGIHYLGEIKRIIPSMKFEGQGSKVDDSQNCLKIQIDSWEKFLRPIQAKEIGFDFFLTNEFLIRQAREIPELFIRSQSEYRLYQELKRVVDDWKVSQRGNAVWFNYRQLHLFIEEEHILALHSGRLIRKFSLGEFERRPNRIIKELNALLHATEEEPIV